MTHRHLASMNSIQVLRPMDRETAEMARAIISLGCMTGSAFASPILFELRKIWFPDILMFFISTTTFLLQYRGEIKTYGPFTLVLAILLGLATFSSAGTSLKELVSWIPLVVWLLVLLTVYSAPRLHQALNSPDPDAAMEEGHSDVFQSLHGQPRSSRPFGGFPTQETDLEMDHLLAHMSRPVSRLSRSSIHDSDIVLNEHVVMTRNDGPRMVSLGQHEYIPRSSSQFSEDAFHPHTFVVHKPSIGTSEDMNYSHRSESPNSLGSQGSQSLQDELEGLLRG